MLHSPLWGVLVADLSDEVPNVGEVAALPAEGVLGAALTEEISVVVLAKEVLLLGYLLRLVYTTLGQFDYVETVGNSSH